MELKSFGNMYQLDADGKTMIYPETKVRWEWKSNKLFNRWYAFNKVDSFEIEKKYNENGNNAKLEISGKDNYTLNIDKDDKMSAKNVDEDLGELSIKEKIYIKVNPEEKGKNKNTDIYTIRRSLIQWFRRGGASYEIYHDKFNKQIENELWENKDSKDIVFNYNGVNVVDIKKDKENDLLFDSGVVSKGKSESGDKLLVRTRVIWLLDNSELPDFMIKILEEKYRETDTSILDIQLNKINDELFENIKKSMNDSVEDLQSSLMVKKEIDGWILYHNKSYDESINPKFYRTYKTTFDVKAPHIINFPPIDAEEEEDSKEDKDYSEDNRTVLLKIQTDISSQVDEDEWEINKYEFKLDNNDNIYITDIDNENQIDISLREEFNKIEAKEDRKIIRVIKEKTKDGKKKEETIFVPQVREFYWNNKSRKPDTIEYRTKENLNK